MKLERKLPFDPKAFLSKVNGGRAISDYRKDQIVFRQGNPADSVFYIRSGKVKKTVASEQGKEAVVALFGTGDFFGEGCLTGQPLRLSTVTAMTECVIVQIAKADITRVIHEEPAPRRRPHQRSPRTPELHRSPPPESAKKKLRRRPAAAQRRPGGASGSLC
jgi:CRP-like cAMP-binding protein